MQLVLCCKNRLAFPIDKAVDFIRRAGKGEGHHFGSERDLVALGLFIDVPFAAVDGQRRADQERDEPTDTSRPAV